MHSTHRLGVLSFVPLAGVLASVFVVVVTTFLAAAGATTAALALPLALLAVLLAVGVAAYVCLVVHIARRPDFTGSDRAMWIIVLFVAGPFGPPVYWLAAVRPRIAR